MELPSPIPCGAGPNTRWLCQAPPVSTQVRVPTEGCFKTGMAFSTCFFLCHSTEVLLLCLTHWFLSYLSCSCFLLKELFSLTKTILLCSKVKAPSGFPHSLGSLFLLLLKLTFIFTCPPLCPDLHRELQMSLTKCLP